MSAQEINQKQTIRIDYIDVFRSFGIIAMVMGHIGYGSIFDFFIHAFHMPMFFWISGFLFCHKSKAEMSFHTLLTKKAKSLLLPYFVFGIAHYLLYVGIKFVTHDEIDIAPLIHLFSINTVGLPISGALWFLTALFFTDILFFLIDRYILNDTLKTIIVVMIALVGNLSSTIFPFTLPFGLSASFVGVGLYYTGYLCKKYAKQKCIHLLMNLSWIPNITLGVITAILIFINDYINMRTATYGFVPLFWINAILSIFVGVNFSKLIYKYTQNSLTGKWLTSVGRDSIVYVCLNQVVIMLVRSGVRIIGLSTYLSSILTLIVTLAILWAISKIIMHTKLKIIMGKSLK